MTSILSPESHVEMIRDIRRGCTLHRAFFQKVSAKVEI